MPKEKEPQFLIDSRKMAKEYQRQHGGRWGAVLVWLIMITLLAVLFAWMGHSSSTMGGL